MNRQYFEYLNKSKKNLNIILLVINLIFPGLYFIVNFGDGYADAESIIIFALLAVLLETIFLPIIHFNYMNSKSGVDSYFALPISRKEIIVTTLVYIILEVVLTHIIAITPILFIEAPYLFNGFTGLFSFLGADLLFIIASILIMTAIFFKAYSAADGIIIIIGYIFAPLLIYLAYFILIVNTTFAVDVAVGRVGYFFYPFLAINNIVRHFEYFRGEGDYNALFSTMIIIALAVVAIYSIRHDIKHRKAEYASSISTNFFSYPLIIAVAAISIIFAIIFSDLNFPIKIMLLAFLFIGYIIINCISRREIKLKAKDFVLFISGIAISFVVLFGSKLTGGFGVETAFRNLDNLVDYQYTIEIQKDADYKNYFYINLNPGYKVIDLEYIPIINEETVSFIKNLQEDYYKAYKEVALKHYPEISDEYTRPKISTRARVNYKDLTYVYPDYNIDYQRREEISGSIYDINDPQVLDKITADVYTLVENGADIFGNYCIDGNNHIEFNNYEDFVKAIGEYLGEWVY